MPDQILHMDQVLHMVKMHIILVLIHLFQRENLRVMNMSIILQIVMFISPQRISLLIPMNSLPRTVKRSALASMPKFLYGARRMRVVKKMN